MVTASGCTDCFTKKDKGKFIGELCAGGFEFSESDGSVVRSSNLTADKTAGPGNLTTEYFINRFKMCADSSYATPKVFSKFFALNIVCRHKQYIW